MSVIVDGATALTSTVVPARRFGLRPGTATDMTSALQSVFDNAPAGSTVETEPGEYVLSNAAVLSRQMKISMRGHWVLQNSIIVSGTNVEIQLAPGSYIEKDPNGTVIEPFLFAGTAPAAWDDITVDPAENDVTITVTTPANFSAGNWIKIKDNKAPYSGSGTHWETNQVRSKVGSVLTLEFPLSDSYVTLAGVKPSVSTFTPVVGSGIMGPGKISNGSATDASIGNAGVRFSHCVAGYVRGAELFQCQADAIRYFDSFGGDISNNYCHQMSNVQIGGVGSGRGMDVSRSTHVLINNNRIFRTRHAIDISNFSRHIVAANNVVHACLYSAMQTHPDVKHVLWTGNVVNGVKGFVANGGAEWGTEYGTAFNVRENNQHVHIIGNQVTDVDSAGVAFSGDLVSDILIKGNTFTRCNVRQQTTVDAAIFLVQGSTSWTIGENIVVEDNLISETAGRGIIVGYSGATVRRNTIKNTTSAGTTAGILVRPYVGSGSPTAISNIEITDNDIQDSAGYGILIGDSSALTTKVTVSGNKIRNTVLSGILAVPSMVDDLTIGQNEIRESNTGVASGHGGITVGAQGATDNVSTNLKIHDNTVYLDTSTRGIMTCVSGAEIVGNKLVGGGANAQGIYITSPDVALTTTGVVVAGNVVDGIPNGIYIGDITLLGTVNGTLVKDNVVRNCTNGIRMRALAMDTTLVNNGYSGNTTNVLDNTSVNTVIRGATHIPASTWGAVPGTGVDMTTAIQAVFDTCPLSAVPVFDPGTYVITNGVALTRSLHVMAFGAVFDLGSSTPAAGYAMRIGSTSATVSGITVDGLTVQRTVAYTGSPTGAASTAFLHKGIVYANLRNSTARNLWAIGFQEGHYITGNESPALGISDTSLYDLWTNECRYGIWITNGNAATHSGGWANEIDFFGGRHVINTDTGTNKHVTDPANFQAVRIDYPNNATLSGSIPNNLRFFGTNLEGAWGRKVYCRGEDVYFYACRYEVPNGGTDLEVDKVSNGGTGRRVSFMGGQGLDAAVLVKTNTVGGATPPQYVAKLAVTHQDYSGGDYPVVETDMTVADLNAMIGTFYNPSGAGQASVRVLDAVGNALRAALMGSITDGTASNYGGLEVYGTTGSFLNSLGVALSVAMPSGSFPMFTRRGFWANKEGGNYDSRVSGQTDDDLTYWDASTDRVGIGTATPDSKLHLVGKHHVAGDLAQDSGNVGLFGATPATQSTGWSATNVTTDKSFDADATTVDELADVLGTLINQLKTHGLLGA